MTASATPIDREEPTVTTLEPSQVRVLFEAVTSGSVAGVDAALSAGVPVDVRDDDGWSALDRAAGRGDAALVDVLLRHGADPLAVGSDLRTPYAIALAAGRTEAARVLRGAELQASPGRADSYMWHPYCRAYLIGQLRAAPVWPQHDGTDLAEDTVVYLHDDHTVTLGIWPGEDVLFAQVDPEWIAFCDEVLHFQVPDDFDLVPDAQSKGSS
jgi:hypothetical protein